MKTMTTKTTEIGDSATEQSRATEAMAQAAERMSNQAQAEDIEIQRASNVSPIWKNGPKPCVGWREAFGCSITPIGAQHPKHNPLHHVLK